MQIFSYFFSKFRFVIFLFASASSIILGTLNAESHDYEKAIKLLLDSGLPDITGAKYIKINLWNAYYPSARNYSEKSDFSGNAWLIEDNGKEASKIVLDNGAVCCLYNSRFVGEKAWDGTLDKGSADWSDANIDADIKKAVKIIRQIVESSDDVPWEFRKNPPWGSYFQFAALIYQYGKKEDANVLFDALFKVSGGAKKVVTEGMSLFADSKYDEAFINYTLSGDLVTYLTRCKELLEMYGGKWKHFKNVKILVKELELLAKGQDLSMYTSLTEDEMNVLRTLFTPRDKGFRTGHMNASALIWILADKKPLSLKKSDDLYFIKELGLSYIPSLVRMLKMEDLTVYPRGIQGLYHNSDTKTRGDVYLKKHFNMSMLRPYFAYELATSILKPLIPEWDDNQYREQYDYREDFQALANDWYESIKDLDREGLNDYYLQNGNPAQKAELINVFMQNGKEEDFAKIETLLLENISDYRIRNSLNEYIEKRGADVAEFVKQYISKMPKNDDFERQKKILEGLISTDTVEELLDAYVAGESKWSDIGDIVISKLSKYDSKKALSTTIDYAVNAKSEDQRATMVFAFGRIGYVMSQKAGHDAHQYLPSQQAEKWRVLLDDDRAYKETHVNAMVASYLEFFMNADKGYGRLQELSVFGKKKDVFLLDYVRAYLDEDVDVDESLWPSADKISEEQLSAIIASIKNKSLSEFELAYSALGMSELLALKQLLNEDADLNKYLADIGKRVKEANVEIDHPAFENLKVFISKQMDFDFIESMRKATLEYYNDTPQWFSLDVDRSGILRKTVISAKIFSDSSSEYRNYNRYFRNRHRGRDHIVILVYQGNDISTLSMPVDPDEDEWFQEDEYKTKVESILDDHVNAMEHIGVTFIGMPSELNKNN